MNVIYFIGIFVLILIFCALGDKVISTYYDHKVSDYADDELQTESSILFDELEDSYSYIKCKKYHAMVDEIKRRGLN